MTTTTVESAYRELLALYLVRQDESALLNAYELGREMMLQGMGLLDVVRIHREAAVAALCQHGSGVTADLALADPLHEVLAPFEMAYRGFQEANASLQVLTTDLEQQVAERTNQLEATLTDLEAADAERRRLLARIVTAQEEERRRIADDLHDDSVQAIAAVGLRIGALRAELGDTVPTERLEALERSVMNAVDRLRRLIFQLRPPELDRDGLAAALRQYLEEIGPEAGLEWAVDSALPAEPPREVRDALYRIAQEALMNVRKHARATSVTVRLEERDGGWLMRIGDDGRGFDPTSLERSAPGHLGIAAMQERAWMASGRCRVTSAPGKGTTVELWMPTPGRLFAVDIG